MLTRLQFRALFDGPDSLLLPIERGNEYVSSEMQRIGEYAIEADIWIESALRACLDVENTGSEWDMWAEKWLSKEDRSLESAKYIRDKGMIGWYCKHYAVQAAALPRLGARIVVAKSALEFAARKI